MERLLVCGDRNWTDYGVIRRWLEVNRTRYDTVIEGCCRGADTIAGRIAETLGFKVQHYPARWKDDLGRYRPWAGPERNQQMLDEGFPDMIWAFHNDIKSSHGTKDMLTKARKVGCPYMIIPDDFTPGGIVSWKPQ